MKRFYLSAAGVAFVALLAATAGFAQPAKHTGEPATQAPTQRRRSCRRSPRTSRRATAGTSA